MLAALDNLTARCQVGINSIWIRSALGKADSSLRYSPLIFECQLFISCYKEWAAGRTVEQRRTESVKRFSIYEMMQYVSTCYFNYIKSVRLTDIKICFILSTAYVHTDDNLSSYFSICVYKIMPVFVWWVCYCSSKHLEEFMSLASNFMISVFNLLHQSNAHS